MPFAAFFVCLLLGLCLLPGTRKPAFCLLLGAVAGMGAVLSTRDRLDRTRAMYAGRPLVLTAQVEQVQESYCPGVVDAVLYVEEVNGTPARFRVSCTALPACKAGQLVRGRFVLSAPARRQQLEWYTDGIALVAELEGQERSLRVLGESTSFRARTHRLQQRLSSSLRRRMEGSAGGVLAAMVVGDRQHLSPALRSAYRGAGLSHVLVVSGMHVSVLCGDILSSVLPYQWELSYRRRKRRAVFRSLLALVLVGVTGFTPSVRRAAVSVWVSALGVWVYGAPDALTSLAAAGILMTAGNSYAVCDIGFELSFAAVLGTVTGGACLYQAREWWCRHFWKNAKEPIKRPWYLKLPERFWGFAESACISAWASAMVFPVLVLRGLSVSLYAVVSGVVVLWMIQPLLLLGLGAAFAGLIPALEPIYGALSWAAAFLAGLLNRWAVWIAAKPGAGLYFDTVYAGLAALVLLGLLWLAYHWRVRWQVAVPCLLVAAGVSLGLGNALSRDVVHLDLVGSVNSPAVVLTQNQTAVVLFRGGASTQRAVENQLARRGVTTVELLVDLRTDPQTPCSLPARQGCRMAVLPAGTTRTWRYTAARVELLRTSGGGLARLTIGNRQLVTLSGTVELARPLKAQWLLASPAKPQGVQYQRLVSLGRYDWMAPGGPEPAASLALRRGGGWNTGERFAFGAGCGTIHTANN